MGNSSSFLDALPYSHGRALPNAAGYRALQDVSAEQWVLYFDSQGVIPVSHSCGCSVIQRDSL